MHKKKPATQILRDRPTLNKKGISVDTWIRTKDPHHVKVIL